MPFLLGEKFPFLLKHCLTCLLPISYMSIIHLIENMNALYLFTYPQCIVKGFFFFLFIKEEMKSLLKWRQMRRDTVTLSHDSWSENGLKLSEIICKIH